MMAIKNWCFIIEIVFDIISISLCNMNINYQCYVTTVGQCLGTTCLKMSFNSSKEVQIQGNFAIRFEFCKI